MPFDDFKEERQDQIPRYARRGRRGKGYVRRSQMIANSDGIDNSDGVASLIAPAAEGTAEAPAPAAEGKAAGCSPFQ